MCGWCGFDRIRLAENEFTFSIQDIGCCPSRMATHFLSCFSQEPKPEVPNIVPERPVEQMVEFSVTLTDQEYTPELSDPTSPQYQKLAEKFQLQVRALSYSMTIQLTLV